MARASTPKTKGRPCPSCGKIHTTLHPALVCLHAWQAAFEQGRPVTFNGAQYAALEEYVRRLGG